MSVKNFNVKPKAFKGEWIASRIDENCIQFMEDFGYHLCAKKKPDDRFPGRDAVTTSQLRTIFGEVKRIEVKLGKEDVAQDILMLRPKIAYNAARTISQNRFSRISDLKEVLEAAHSNIDTDDQEPSRLIVRDGEMLNANEFNETELLYTEVKAENSIDRVTARANPRFFERVPKGATFNLEMVINIFDQDPNGAKFLDYTYEALRLVQDDYLGGSGSRGNGQVNVKLESVAERHKAYYSGDSAAEVSLSHTIPEDLK